MLVNLSDVIALVEGLEAEPRGAQKVWIQEPSTSRLIARLQALPRVDAPQPAPPPAPTLLHGLDAQGWYDTARRYHVGLETIIKTEGHGIDHDWCRRQAAYYLGRAQDGSMVWQMPGAPELHHIVVPDPALNFPRRIEHLGPAAAQPAAEPIVALKQGEEALLTIARQDDGDAG